VTSAGSVIFFRHLFIFENETLAEYQSLKAREDLGKKNDEEIRTLQEEKSELLRLYEEIYEKEELTAIESEKHIDTIEVLQTEIEKYKAQSSEGESAHLSLKEEFTGYKKLAEKGLLEEKNRLNEALQTISELRATVSTKQDRIESLQTKIHDLTYEIKTLLNIADFTQPAHIDEPELPGISVNETVREYQVAVDALSGNKEEAPGSGIHMEDDAKRQLKRCLDIAQKITGAQHFSENKSRFGDFVLDNYALNLRRLCESLRSENQCTVFVYSPKEKKPIFINDAVKDLLGWNPEKFVNDFDGIVQDGIFEWQNSVSRLNTLNFGQTRFVMKAKSGKDHLIHCQLGLIPTGVFRSNIVGVLYPA